MIAPRALLNLEQSGIAWLGPGATHINDVATREVFAPLALRTRIRRRSVSASATASCVCDVPR